MQIRNEWTDPAEPARLSLAEVLDELKAVLRAAGQGRWARYIGDCRSRLRGGGIEKLMRAYGGMGSLNDLWFGGAGQDRFEELKCQAYVLAKQLQATAKSRP